MKIVGRNFPYEGSKDPRSSAGHRDVRFPPVRTTRGGHAGGRGYPTSDQYPPELAGRQQVVRAYDQQGRIADGVLAADGKQAAVIIAELLARPEVELVHLRNVGYGCYNFSVRATG